MNIVFVNLLPFVLFSLFDGYIMPIVLGEKTGIASPYVLFVLSLVSVLPLVYYVGMGVACVSAQVQTLGRRRHTHGTMPSVLGETPWPRCPASGRCLISDTSPPFLCLLLLYAPFDSPRLRLRRSSTPRSARLSRSCSTSWPSLQTRVRSTQNPSTVHPARVAHLVSSPPRSRSLPHVG